MQKGIECFVKGFNIVINNNYYNWQAAMRYAQTLLRPTQEDNGNLSDSLVQSKRNAQDNISSLQMPRSEKFPKINYNRSIFRTDKMTQPLISATNLSQSVQAAAVLSQTTNAEERMDTNFWSLFDEL